LVFCYNLASDDPEGVQVYTRIYRRAKKLTDNGDVLFVVGNNDILVNSIQRFSSVIIQKSIKEGFCLSVTEALWKGRPVVASNVGGLPAQIEDGKNGFLLQPRDLDGFAERIIYILKHPEDAKKLGESAKETVRQKFLITRLLSDYLDMLNSIMRNQANQLPAH
jgi:trehalose synthase